MHYSSMYVALGTIGPVLIVSCFFQYTILTITKCITSIILMRKPYANTMHVKMLKRNYFATQLRPVLQYISKKGIGIATDHT